MADPRLQSQGIVVANIPQTPTDAAQAAHEGQMSIAASFAKSAATLQDQSKKIFQFDFETQARQNAEDIFNNSPNDPNLVKQKLDEYGEGIFKNIDPRERVDLQRGYQSITQPYITKAFDNKNKLITGQLVESVEANRERILIDINNNSEDIFVSDPSLSPADTQLKQASAYRAMEENFESLNRILSTVGPTGQPLYSAKEKAKILSNAKEVVLSNISRKWMDTQPNKLKAYNEWRNGDFKMPMVDGDRVISVPVNQMFNPRVLKKVEKELVSDIRNELSIIDKLEKRQERIEKKVGDQLTKNLYDAAQGGDLNERSIDDVGKYIPPKEFRALKKLARTREVVTNGSVYNDLSVRAMQGEDVFNEALLAVEQGNLNNRDLVTIRGLQTNRISGFTDPISRGRENLLAELASDPEIMKGVNKTASSRGVNEYEAEIEEFIRINGRDPSRTEAIEISNPIADRYRNMDVESLAIIKPAPTFGSDFKTNPKELTVDKVKDTEKTTLRFYVDKHNGDIDKAVSDPKYIDQARLIDEWKKVASSQEQRRQRIASRRSK